MIKDENKQITNIVYNNMNLPIEIRINGMMGENQIHYIYTADGTKLRQFVYGQNEMGVDTKKFTDYIGNIVYINNTLAFILTPEGRITNNEAIKQFKHEYFIKDHLGNTRTVVDGASGRPIEENSYYPFGMQIDALSKSATRPENRYKYNGKELTSDFGLDWYEYGARSYDPQAARFLQVDPLAEERSWLNPYNYVQNNPITRIDPTGMLDDIVIWYEETVQTSVNVFGKTVTSSTTVNKSWTFDGTNAADAPDNKFVNDFLTAYEYNVSNGKKAGNGGGDKLKTAAFSENEHEVVKSSGSSAYFSEDFRFVVRWNPSEGLKTTAGHILSPATLLEHEFDHSTDQAKNYPEHVNRYDAENKSYTNEEEKRVITGSEQKTAIANGEIKKWQYTRNDHKGTHVKVQSVISTKEK